jgi:DNA-binding NtrC family response regulator
LFRYITKPWDPDDLIQVLHAAAAAYDAKAEQQRLLADLRQHVEAGQRLASELQSPAGAAFRQTGDQLLARLQRAMPPDPGQPNDGAPQ